MYALINNSLQLIVYEHLLLELDYHHLNEELKPMNLIKMFVMNRCKETTWPSLLRRARAGEPAAGRNHFWNRRVRVHSSRRSTAALLC